MSALINQARSRVPRIAEAAVERARLSVVPRTTSRAPRMPFVVLVSLLLVGGVAGLLFFNTSMQQASFTQTALEDQARALDAQQQSLTMDLDALRDPQRVAVQAKQMGMVAPDSPAFIRLSDGAVLGDPEPATAQGGMEIAPRPTRVPADLRPKPLKVWLDQPAEATHAAGAPAATQAKKLSKQQAKKVNEQHSGAADAAAGTPAGTKKSHTRQQGSTR